ncbi:MAG: hypothetical protein WCK34_10870 [Bacteroidota bacterium]
MKRITFLVFIAIVAFAVILWVKRPDIVGNLWLWLVGLAGPIIAFVRRIIHEIDQKNLFKPAAKKTDPAPAAGKKI